MRYAITGHTWKHITDPAPVPFRKKKTLAYQGSKHGKARLTEDMVIEDRKLYETTEISIAELAKKRKVAYSTMRKTLCGDLWSHVPNAVKIRSDIKPKKPVVVKPKKQKRVVAKDIRNKAALFLAKFRGNASNASR